MYLTTYAPGSLFVFRCVYCLAEEKKREKEETVLTMTVILSSLSKLMTVLERTTVDTNIARKNKNQYQNNNRNYNNTTLFSTETESQLRT